MHTYNDAPPFGDICHKCGIAGHMHTHHSIDSSHSQHIQQIETRRLIIVNNDTTSTQPQLQQEHTMGALVQILPIYIQQILRTTQFNQNGDNTLRNVNSNPNHVPTSTPTIIIPQSPIHPSPPASYTLALRSPSPTPSVGNEWSTEAVIDGSPIPTEKYNFSLTPSPQNSPPPFRLNFPILNILNRPDTPRFTGDLMTFGRSPKSTNEKSNFYQIYESCYVYNDMKKSTLLVFGYCNKLSVYIPECLIVLVVNLYVQCFRPLNYGGLDLKYLSHQRSGISIRQDETYVDNIVLSKLPLEYGHCYEFKIKIIKKSSNYNSIGVIDSPKGLMSRLCETNNAHIWWDNKKLFGEYTEFCPPRLQGFQNNDMVRMVVDLKGTKWRIIIYRNGTGVFTEIIPTYKHYHVYLAFGMVDQYAEFEILY